MEEFRKGWVNAICLPDNLADMAFDLTAFVSIPALLTSFWVSLPLPSFFRLGVLGVLVVSGVVLCYLRQVLPEVENVLLLRISLVALGVILGL